MEPLASIVGTFALGIGAASFASISKDTADSPGRQATPKLIFGPTALESYYEAKLKTDGIPNPFIKP